MARTEATRRARELISAHVDAPMRQAGFSASTGRDPLTLVTYELERDDLRFSVTAEKVTFPMDKESIEMRVQYRIGCPLASDMGFEDSFLHGDLANVVAGRPGLSWMVTPDKFGLCRNDSTASEWVDADGSELAHAIDEYLAVVERSTSIDALASVLSESPELPVVRAGYPKGGLLDALRAIQSWRQAGAPTVPVTVESTDDGLLVNVPSASEVRPDLLQTFIDIVTPWVYARSVTDVIQVDGSHWKLVGTNLPTADLADATAGSLASGRTATPSRPRGASGGCMSVWR